MFKTIARALKVWLALEIVLLMSLILIPSSLAEEKSTLASPGGNFFKLNLANHSYPPSPYFECNKEIFERADFDGAGVEAEIGRKFDQNWSWSYSIGRYDSQVNSTIEGTSVEFLTIYILTTLKYHFPGESISLGRYPLQAFVGIGGGAYWLIIFVSADDPVPSIAEGWWARKDRGGFHLVGGLELLLSPSLGLSIEYRWAWAKVLQANSHGDILDVGGESLSLGISLYL